MRNNIIFILILSLFLEAAKAQMTTSADTIKYSKAQIFNFSGWNLSGGIGCKFIYDEYQLRISINGSYSKQQSQPSYSYTSTSTRGNLSIDILYPLRKVETVLPYLGAGLGFAGQVDETEYSDGSPKYESYSFGPSGKIFIGVEYWVLKQISLSGEQSISATYTRGINSSKTYQIGNATSSLLLSVYF